MNTDHLKDLIKELISLPVETPWVEFKVNNHQPKRTGEIISGLANSACLHQRPFGYMVFGIDNKTHKVIGTSFSPSQTKIGNEEIESWWQQHLSPKLDFRMHEFEFNGQPIVVFEIPAAIDRPVSFSNVSYIRIGSTTRKLSDFHEKERQIWKNSAKFSFEKGIALTGLTPDGVLSLIDFSAYFSLTKQSFPLGRDGIVDRLLSDKIIIKSRGRFDITNLGAILLAKDVEKFPTIKRKAIRVVMYNGKDRIKTKKEIKGRKGYAVAFEGLINYINDQIPSNEEIPKALRKDDKMYPGIAIRELVANALIHQDFNIDGTGPMVEIFTDRIEINNPGKPLVNIDRFIDLPPQSRNEDLASFMRRVSICEERGSGIDKVIFNAELYQLPAPNFETNEDYTKATLFAYKTLKGMSKNDKIRACYQHACLRYVSYEKMTNTSLRQRFKIKASNYSIASRILGDTLNAGLIKLDESGGSKSKKHAKYIPFWA